MFSKIIAVGSMSFDKIHLPNASYNGIGGSAHYFSLGSSYFARTLIITTVGTDFPVEHLKFLESRNIDISHVLIQTGQTFQWEASYKENFNNPVTLSTQLNVFENFYPKLTDSNEQITLFLANIDPRLQENVLNHYPQAQLIAMDTMNYWISTQMNTLKKLIQRVHILFINESEIQLLTGCLDLLTAGLQLLEQGPLCIILKRAEKGAIIFLKNHTPLFFDAFMVKQLVDPTGAGDVFAGGVLGYLCQQQMTADTLLHVPTLQKAIDMGCILASFKIEAKGFEALKGLRKETIDQRLNSWR